ncbi:hypothetical protein [Pisciglobus halotolerans]|uniref:hypothetical protein n=1 Tax=Pisciglobus halotolerans TaxID=745365 RepID=UPI000B84CE46|nr:hypothetical protein [Pisciglobus halotolerans]
MLRKKKNNAFIIKTTSFWHEKGYLKQPKIDIHAENRKNWTKQKKIFFLFNIEHSRDRIKNISGLVNFIRRKNAN